MYTEEVGRMFPNATERASQTSDTRANVPYSVRSFKNQDLGSRKEVPTIRVRIVRRSAASCLDLEGLFGKMLPAFLYNQDAGTHSDCIETNIATLRMTKCA